jgi:DNA uptake protein ComE-like DNA-binding protein
MIRRQMTIQPQTTSGKRPLWPVVSLTPLGLGAWVPIYAGAKARRPLWIAMGLLFTLVTIAGWILASATSGDSDAGGGLIILGWVGAIATSFSVAPAYRRQMSSPLQVAAEAGDLRLSDREQARRLARTNPRLAQEIGIGRPDRAGADAGLVDANNASVTALLTLPGVDGDLATQIIETREQVNGFSSVEDMGLVMDLAGDLVEDLRNETVFLPRRGGA